MATNMPTASAAQYKLVRSSPSKLRLVHEWLMCHLPRITGNEFKVLFALSFHLNAKTGSCYPSLETLSDLTGIDKKGVLRALKVLAERRIIRIDPGLPGRGKSNLYVLLATPKAFEAFKEKCDNRRKARLAKKVANVIPFQPNKRVA